MSHRMNFKNSVSVPIFLKSPLNQAMRVRPSIQTAWHVTGRRIATLAADDVRNACLSPRGEKVSSHIITRDRSVISKIMETQS